jgi:hypothetical protein
VSTIDIRQGETDMPNDNLQFTISWQGTAKARVHYVIDNGTVVKTETDGLEGHSPITCEYAAPAAAVHVLEWSLWFPGHTVKQLAATVAINGGAPVTLDAREDEAKNKWSGRGAAP